MLALVRNRGRVLEPACGDGAFLQHFPFARRHRDRSAACAAGRAHDGLLRPARRSRLPRSSATRPMCAIRTSPATTRRLVRRSVLDGRANLYLFFIEKCLRHLAPGGELIFITPRDFLKATSAVPLNRLLHAGDDHRFRRARRFQAVRRRDAELRHLAFRARQLSRGGRATRPRALPTAWPAWRDCSGRSGTSSRAAGTCCSPAATMNCTWPTSPSSRSARSRRRRPLCQRGLRQSRLRLLVDGAQRPDAAHALVRAGRAAAGGLAAAQGAADRAPHPAFDETNWWQWGRGYHQSALPRVYVNSKTRRAQPFFVHDCPNYDGAVLAIFPRDPALSTCRPWPMALNRVDWADLGFVCDGRFLFTQRSLEQTPLPGSFEPFQPTAV
jgi:adenine-specific DNA-methyltransferase